jgi:starch synthase (maltosyl-transferring)
MLRAIQLRVIQNGMREKSSKEQAHSPGKAGLTDQGRNRAIIEGVSPEIDEGQFAIKRVRGEKVAVEADIFADGHDALAALLLYRAETESNWTEVPMEHLGNDRWRASFEVRDLGDYFYTIQAWVDHFKSWRFDLKKRLAAAQDVSVDLLIGSALVLEAAGRAQRADAQQLKLWAHELENTQLPAEHRSTVAMSVELSAMMERNADRRFASIYSKELRVSVDSVLARFSAWYEFFPRSFAREPGRHGTFRDCEAQLERIARLGFDVVYLPPIHPVGLAYRKGRNNNSTCEPGEPGSPWGIGGAEGGHKAVHPELGTLEDFRWFVLRARELGLSVALDMAFQCSADHPYVREHPEWFRKRPDGTIQYAENPPKKYQDIYPLNFETEDWQALWRELKSVFEFWIEQGVRIFRVDNPHTKSFAFWEWAIGELKSEHRDLIFLSEAFTRPKVMYYLAKIGFNQSYNYFPWRNTKWELAEYMTELTQAPVREFFRPNLWPNTPDILTQYLQYGGRPAFITRLVLAATLGASYGIYGPAYELYEHKAREIGSEEYLNSEKYEIRRWNLDAPGNLEELLGQVNAIRRENPALHSNDRLVFHQIDNEQLVAYSKTSEDGRNIILVVVCLDPHHAQSGWTHLDLARLGIDPHLSFQVHDLLTDARYLWQGPRNFVELRPYALPAHIFRIRRRVSMEQDFEYFM